MRPHLIRQALDAYARRHLSPRPDLWPAIQQQIGARSAVSPRIHIEPAGRRVALLLPTALLALLVVAVLTLAPRLQPAAPAVPTSPGPPGAANPAGAPGASGLATAPTAGDPTYYATLLTHNFASRLGVDVATLDRAFSRAAAATIDQAVQDGQLTPDAATQAKALANQGLAAVLVHGLDAPGKGSGALDPADNGAMQAAVDAVLPALAPLFGLSPDQLTSTLKQGQSLAALEQAHHVTAQQVHDTALAAIHAALTTGVRGGRWTQAQADTTYQDFSQNIDNLLLKITGGGSGAGDDGPGPAVLQAALAAIAPLLGLTPDQLGAALKQGQSLAALEQAHHVTAQQAHDAAVAAGRAALAAGVQSHKWTQAQVDAAVPDLDGLVTGFLAKMEAGPRAAPGAASPTTKDLQHYADLLVQNFATQLGVDLAKLNTAFTAAASATIDQAVQAGNLTPDAATRARAQAGQGLAAILANALGQRDNGAGGAGAAKGQAILDNSATQAAIAAVLPAVAGRLGLSVDQLTRALQQGQSLAALEQAQQVTAPQVRDAVRAAIHAALTTGVQGGHWTQAQADSTDQEFSQNIDNLLLKITSGAAGAGDDGPGPAVLQAALAGLAQLFGLTPDQLSSALKQGQSLAALEQAHQVSAQQAQDAAIAAGRAALATGVQNHKWTQAEVDAAVPDLAGLVDKLLTKMGGGGAAPVGTTK